MNRVSTQHVGFVGLALVTMPLALVMSIPASGTTPPTGDIVARVDPNLNANHPTTEWDTASLFDERQCQPGYLAAGLMTDDGTVIPANDFFSCVMIHFDPTSSFGVHDDLSGRVTMDDPVYGIVTSAEGLDGWDGVCRRPDVAYPTADATRGLEGLDAAVLDGNALDILLFETQMTDSIRVITECSGPSAPGGGLGG